MLDECQEEDPEHGEEVRSRKDSQPLVSPPTVGRFNPDFKATPFEEITHTVVNKQPSFE